MQFKDRIQIIKAQSSIAIRFDLTKGFLKSTTTKPQYAQYVFNKMVYTKILAMVKQRRYQIAAKLAPTNSQIDQALINAQAKLHYMPNWNTTNWRKSLAALLPNLIDIAPTTGRFAPAWDSLLDGIQSILEVEDLPAELNHCIYG